MKENSPALENPQLIQFFHKKKVIIVGRSDYTLKTPEYDKQGEFIDSHDIVCRPNTPVPGLHNEVEYYEYQKITDPYVPEKFWELLGKRTDVLFINNRHRTWEEQYLNEIHSFKNSGGVFIYGYHGLNMVERRRFKEEIDRLKRIVPYHQTSYEFYQFLQYEFVRLGIAERSSPHGGICSVANLLRYDIKELRLIGFTSYQEHEDSILRSMIPNQHHLDLQWLKHKYETDSRITTGHVLLGILQRAGLDEDKREQTLKNQNRSYNPV